jgi:hypothetical protein
MHSKLMLAHTDQSTSFLVKFLQSDCRLIYWLLRSYLGFFTGKKLGVFRD